ncbi:unnamed protein product [Ixodes hexagonus]
MSVDIYRDVNGVFVGKHFPEDAVLSVMAYVPQPGDVFIVSYPKCGTTWMQHIVYNILMDGNPPPNKLDPVFRMPFLELQGADAARHGLKPGAFKTHLPFDKHPYSQDAKYIYITRNPFDCCVSFYHHTRHFPMYHFEEGTFAEFLEMFLAGKVDFGDYFKHLLSWYDHKDDANVLFLTYEDLKKDTRSWLLKVADFLGEEYGAKLRRDEGLIEKVLKMVSLEGMKGTVDAHFKSTPGADVSSEDMEQIPPELRQGLQNLQNFLAKPMTGDFFTYLYLSRNIVMTKYATFILAFLVAGALGGTPQDSNLYLDSVLIDHLPGNVRSLNLDPAALPELKVRVKSSFVSNRELKAELRKGAVHGLSTALRRRGECAAPGYQGPDVTVGCYVNLDGVRVSYEVKAKGHNFAGIKATYNLDLYVQNSNAFVEVTSRPPQAGVLKTLTLSGVDFRIVHGKNLGLNNKRQKEYDDALRSSVQGALLSLFYGKFRDALNLSVSRVAFPRV